jgi:sortase A
MAPVPPSAAAEPVAVEPRQSEPEAPPPQAVVTRPAAERPPPPPPRAFTPRSVVVAVVVWLVSTLVAVGLVLYGVGPLLHKRDQRELLSDLRVEIRQAAGSDDSFSEVEVVTTAPGNGDPVAILDIPDLKLQQVVVEGVGPQQTRHGPGHVPGSAGPGQPGNSAIVARRSAFGGSFGELGGLERGDRILVTTTQGRSVYEVEVVRRLSLKSGTGTVAPSTTTTSSTTTTTAPPAEGATATGTATDQSTTTASTTASTTTAPVLRDARRLSTDEIYGPSEDDRLTLVTSASRLPWATDRATIVVATMADHPFEPTPQNGRSVAQDGRGSDANAWAPMTLAGIAYAMTAVAAVLIYRRARVRSAYLLTAPPLVAATFLTAETIARLMPAWF